MPIVHIRHELISEAGPTIASVVRAADRAIAAIIAAAAATS
eukprot:CAMPEP_0115519152 /NCGR_PEP_ID=MMETSP0271-20121206/78277_1 /TAXON_ID=71861 /ORGANISM="Scrippsiella trochoidea, Strain CCMP3099" /LENGTH=40 /DNA_ID= /DNA_START= /DNA_END= /DNA_ORIENTATION=